MQFINKPVAIEAVRFAGMNGDGDPTFKGAIPVWLGDAMAEAQDHVGAIWVNYNTPTRDDPLGQRPKLIVGSLKGNIRATPSDWIIRGIAGELYTCREDIFEATYSAAAEKPSEMAAGVLHEPGTDGVESNSDDADLLKEVGTDGQKWAQAFLAKDFPPDDINEGLMTGWFCNAIMAGYDEARRKYQQDPDIITSAIYALQMAEDKFNYYAGLHGAKETPEGDAKAKANIDMAEMMHTAIHGKLEIPHDHG